MTFPLTVYKASAGSGKTFTLATEYIRLLVRNPLNYKQILAVTFTNKATEEMKMRILSQLYGIWRHLPDSESYATKVFESLEGELSRKQMEERAGQALHLLLHNYSYFRVETIDSFFQSVLRNLARELNLTANLRVGLNDVQVEELAVDKIIDSLSATDMMLQWLMKYIMESISDDRSWNVIGQIKKFGKTIFEDYYKEHSEELKTLMNTKGFFESYLSQLREMQDQARERMKAIAASFFDELSAEGLTANDLKYGNKGVAGLFLKLQNGVFDESILTKRVTDCQGQPENWYTKSHPRHELLHHLAETTLDSILRYAIEEQPRQWKLFKSADTTLRHLNQLRLLGSIEQKVRELNDEQNCFLLSDTQQLLHELIEGSDTPFIFEKIGSQLEHIMIDEFQDTSTVQWQNFKVLLEETMSHKHSRNLIVGDVKQSIYRWRNGDWRLLAGIMGQFDHPDEMVHISTLGTNYRSARRIVDFNNAFFTEAARQEGIDAYDDVIQKVPVNKDDSGHVKVTLLPAADYEQKTLEVLCEQVSMLLANGASASDIAILVRANDKIPRIANYFMEHLPEIKVVSDEAFRLDSSTAVVTIVQALRYLAHPDDVIARAYLAKNYSGRIDGELPEGFTPALLQLPLYEMAEQLYALFLNGREGQQSAYLCAFYDLVTAFVIDNGSDVEAFLREWDGGLNKKTIQSPETDGLRIVSIHKSKGLEFPHVLIPFCSWKLELSDILWLTPREAPFNQLPLVPVDFYPKSMKGTIYESDYDEEHQQNIVDNMNLLYVAFTRASSSLYIYGLRKAVSGSRSVLIEQVLPATAEHLEGAVLEGEEDKDAPLVFEYGSPFADHGEAKEADNPHQSSNPFLQESTPLRINIEVFPTKVNFKQSNKSRDFAHQDDDEQALQMEYIQLGSVLHNVLSTIRTTDDIDAALWQLEQDGVLYHDTLSHDQLVGMLRKRLESPRVAEWFRPGRWTLYNECTILNTDPQTGKVVERRPDRVMTDGRKTIVVDFKFGREREEYHEQVRQYMALLKQIGLPAVRGYLWLVYSNKIIEVTNR